MADEKKDSMSYEKLYEISRLEKRRDELQKLDAGFFLEALTLIRHQLEEVRRYEHSSDIEGTAKAQNARRELDNIRKIVREIYDRRESKIIDMAVTKTRTATHIADTSLMMAEEKRFYEEMIAMLSDYRKSMIDSIIIGEEAKKAGERGSKEAEQKGPEKQKEVPDKIRVRFLAPIPQFLGEDLEPLGPFAEDAAVTLPRSIAEALIERKKAERVK